MRVMLYYDTVTLGSVVPLRSPCSMSFGSRAAHSAARELRATMNETSDDDDDEVRANGTEDIQTGEDTRQL